MRKLAGRTESPISDSKALVTEGDMNRERSGNRSPQNQEKSGTRSKSRGGAMCFYCGKPGSLPKELSTLPKRQRGSRRCSAEEDTGQQEHLGDRVK